MSRMTSQWGQRVLLFTLAALLSVVMPSCAREATSRKTATVDDPDVKDPDVDLRKNIKQTLHDAVFADLLQQSMQMTDQAIAEAHAVALTSPIHASFPMGAGKIKVVGSANAVSTPTTLTKTVHLTVDWIDLRPWSGDTTIAVDGQHELTGTWIESIDLQGRRDTQSASLDFLGSLSVTGETFAFDLHADVTPSGVTFDGTLDDEPWAFEIE